MEGRFVVSSGQAGEVVVHRVCSDSLELVDRLPPVEGCTSREWLTLHPRLPKIYSFSCFWKPMKKVRESEARTGEMTVLDIDLETGKLMVCAVHDSLGRQPCAAAVSPDASQLAVAHYLDGRVAVFPLLPDGTPDAGAARVLTLPGVAGGPPRPPGGGERLLDGRTGPLCHGVAYSPPGEWIMACDAGQGRVLAFRSDLRSGAGPVISEVRSEGDLGGLQRLMRRRFGCRPRHLAFHPRGGLVYVLFECTNEVAVHGFDEASGALGPAVQELACGTLPSGSCLPCTCLGINAASEIEVARDGSAVFASTRGVMTGSCLTRFEVLEDGRLRRRCVVDAGGRMPRHFCMPRPGLLLAGLELSGAVGLFDASEGGLRLTASLRLQGAEGPGPQCVQVFPCGA